MIGSDQMRIGTTPTHTFTLPSEIANVAEKVRVVYAQGDTVVLTKDVNALSGNDVIVKLTQEETLKFRHDLRVEIQLRILTSGGEALTSDIVIRKPYECLEKEVLV